MPLRAAIPKTVKKPTSEPSEMMPPADESAASTPPTSADGRVKNRAGARRKLPKDSQQEEEDRRCSGEDAEAEQRLLGGLPLRVLAEHLGVVAEREVDLLERVVSTSLRDRAEVAPRHVGADVDAPRSRLRVDDVRGRLDAPRRRPSSSRTCPPSGVSIGSSWMLGEAVAAVAGVLQTWTS